MRKNTRTFVVSLSIFLTFLLTSSSLVISQTPRTVKESGVINQKGVERSADWIKEHCKNTGVERSVFREEYVQYKCENHLQISLDNRDETKEGVTLKPGENKVKYKIRVTYNPDTSYNPNITAELTNFGPNSSFQNRLGEYIKSAKVSWNPEGDWTDVQPGKNYRLKDPIELEFSKNNTKRELYANIIVERPESFDTMEGKIGLYSAKLNIEYPRFAKVWVRKERSLPVRTINDQTETNEGVTIQSKPKRPAYVIPGELEQNLYVSPVHSQATVRLEQTKTSPGADTKAAVFVRKIYNVSTRRNVLNKDLNVLKLEGSGDYYKQAILEPDKGLNKFIVRIHYQVKEGWEGRYQKVSNVERVTLEEAAPIVK